MVLYILTGYWVLGIVFFYVGPPKEYIFLTTIYSLYFNQQGTYITDYNSWWASESTFMYCINSSVIYPQARFDPPFQQSDAEFTEWKTDALAN